MGYTWIITCNSIAVTVKTSFHTPAKYSPCKTCIFLSVNLFFPLFSTPSRVSTSENDSTQARHRKLALTERQSKQIPLHKAPALVTAKSHVELEERGVDRAAVVLSTVRGRMTTRFPGFSSLSNRTSNRRMYVHTTYPSEFHLNTPDVISNNSPTELTLGPNSYLLLYPHSCRENWEATHRLFRQPKYKSPDTGSKIMRAKIR